MSTTVGREPRERRRKRTETEVNDELLERQIRRFDRFSDVQPGQYAYVFPWSAGWRCRPRNLIRLSKSTLIRHPKEVLDPCPIYRALSPFQKRQLVTRAPKTFRNYTHPVWLLLDVVLDAYVGQKAPGVSPVTAMALLTPESWYLMSREHLTPERITPRPFHFRDSSGRLVTRPTKRWQVVVWAIKRYCHAPWRDIMKLSPDLMPTSEAARHLIVRNVEEPLRAFYRALTGDPLDPAEYSAALSDSSQSSPEQRDRMKSLKQAVKRGQPWIPEI